MKKIILIGTDWCPVTKEAKKFWQGFKEEYRFEYEYINIESEEGKKLVQKYSITSVPKTLVENRIVFDGVPDRKKAAKLLNRVTGPCRESGCSTRLLTRLKDDVHARATLGIIIGMIICCALPILVLGGFGTALVVALQRWDLWFWLAAIILGISILYVIVRRVANAEE